MDQQTGRVRQPLPTLEDAAAFYAKNSGVPAPDFLARAASPEVDTQVRAAEEFIRGGRITGTPAIVVNGRYLINSAETGTWDGIRQLVEYLLTLERARLKMPTPKRPG
jgi:thiol:disulfide interchange protein DsbA